MPPAVSQPLSAEAPIWEAKLPLRRRPPEARLRVSGLLAKVRLPAAVETRFKEFNARVPAGRICVPVHPVTLALLVPEESSPVPEATVWV